MTTVDGLDREPVTEGETALETAVRSAVSAEDPSEGANARMRAGARARLPHFLTARPALARAWAVTVGDLPSVWSQAPTTPAELVRYAADGAWCGPESVRLRVAGRVYCAAVAIPVSVAAYLAAWVVQRPGRLAAAVVLVGVVWFFG